MILLIHRSRLNNWPLPNGPQIIAEFDTYDSAFTHSLFITDFSSRVVNNLKNSKTISRGYINFKTSDYTYYSIADTDIMDSRSAPLSFYDMDWENHALKNNFSVIKRLIKSWKRNKVLDNILN